MAEFNIKTIEQLQQLTRQSKLDGTDFLIVYERDNGTTNKISLDTLKNLTLEDQKALGADSTFKVENTNLSIGKKSILVPTEEIEDYFLTNGISLGVNELETCKIIAVEGDGVSFDRDTNKLIISQLPPNLIVSDDQNHSFNTNTKRALKFTGAVSINEEAGTIHINDKDTVLQAITNDYQEGINISKIKSAGNVTFSTSSLTDGGTLLTIGLEGASTADKAFSLRSYTATSNNNKDYICQEIQSFSQDQVIAIYFDSSILYSPTTLNGKKIVYYNEHGDKKESIINSIIQDYAILKKQLYGSTIEYRVIFADALQTLNKDWIVDSSNDESQSGFPATVTVTSALSNVSFTALTPTLFDRSNETNEYYIQSKYIKNLSNENLSSNLTLSYNQLRNEERDENDNPLPGYGTSIIPKKFLPSDIGKITLIDGQEITYSDSNESLIFTNAEEMQIPDGGQEGSSSTASKLIEAESYGYDVQDNSFTLKNITEATEGFYLVEFKNGGFTSTPKRGTKIKTENDFFWYIYYNGSSSQDIYLPKTLIQENDSVLFYYDGTYFRYISNDDANGNRVLINQNESNNIITFEQNGQRYDVNQADFSAKTLNTNTSKFININDSNTSISIDFILSDSQDAQDLFLRGDGEWSIPSFTPLLPPETAPEEEENPEEYDRSNLFLDGDGEWSPVINNSLRLYLMDLLFPEGSIFYTTDPNFRPEEPTITDSNIHIGNLNEPNYTWQQIGTTTQGGKTIYLWEKVKNNNQQAG